MTEEEFRNGVPKPPESIQSLDDYKNGYAQGIFRGRMEILEKMIRPPLIVQEVTLRDRFAMAALTGMMFGNLPKSDDKLYVEDRNRVAKQAYQLADAMLEARGKK